MRIVKETLGGEKTQLGAGDLELIQANTIGEAVRAVLGKA